MNLLSLRRATPLFALAALFAAPAAAQLSVDVTGQIENDLRIAVPAMPAQQNVDTPAGSSELLGQKIAEVIAADLNTSGLFAPLGPAGVPRPTMPEVTNPAFERWSGMNAEALVQGFVRTSGGKGLHVVAPFRRGPSWTAVKAFCERIADAMVAESPRHYIAEASKAKREGLIFIDWLRNTRGATSVTGWSLRARPGAPVAMPVGWGEIARLKSGAAFDLTKALKRAKSLEADPWAGIAELKQSLPS